MEKNERYPHKQLLFPHKTRNYLSRIVNEKKMQCCKCQEFFDSTTVFLKLLYSEAPPKLRPKEKKTHVLNIFLARHSGFAFKESRVQFREELLQWMSFYLDGCVHSENYNYGISHFRNWGAWVEWGEITKL